MLCCAAVPCDHHAGANVFTAARQGSLCVIFVDSFFLISSALVDYPHYRSCSPRSSSNENRSRDAISSDLRIDHQDEVH